MNKIKKISLLACVLSLSLIYSVNADLILRTNIKKPVAYIMKMFFTSDGLSKSLVKVAIDGTVGNISLSGDLKVGGKLCLGGICKSNFESYWTQIGSNVVYSGGNVGIKKNNPGYELDVAGTINATQVLVNGAPITTAEQDPQVGTLTNNKWCKTDGTTINCTTDTPLDSMWKEDIGKISYMSGNVGIGTSTIGSDEKVRVQGGHLVITNTLGTILSTLGHNTGGGFLAGYDSGGNVKNFISSIPGQNSFLNNGSVGIGTSTPSSSYKLDINGALNALGGTIRNNATATNFIVDSDDNQDAKLNIRKGGGVRRLLRRIANDDNLRLYSFGTSNDVMYWDYVNGNVGMGTITPNARLHVSKSVNNGESLLGHFVNGGGGNAIATVKIGEGATDTNEGQYGVLGHYGVDNSFRIGNMGPSGNNGYLSFHVGINGSGTTLGSANEKMRITNGGNVGIGTTSPGAKLELANGMLRTLASSTNMDLTFGKGIEMMYRTDSPNDYGLIQSYDRDNSKFKKLDINSTGLNLNTNYVKVTNLAGTELMRISSGGNVGIGTTSPTSKLFVSGNGATIRSTVKNTASTGYAGSEIAGNTASIYPIAFGSNVPGTIAGLSRANMTLLESTLNSSFLISTTNSSGAPIIFAPERIEKMRITTGGNIGIGTTSPLSKLHIQDNINGSVSLKIKNSWPTASQATEAISFLGYRDVAADHVVADIKALNKISTAYGNTVHIADLAFFTLNDTNAANSPPATTEKMRITSEGNVGIGTPTPGVKLDVNGAIQSVGDICIKNGSCLSSMSSKGDSYSLDAHDGSPQDVVYVDDAGNVGIGATAPSTVLDVRRDQNGPTQIRARNDSVGGGASADIATSLGSWTQYLAMKSMNASFITNGLLAANSNALFSVGGSAGMNVFTFDNTDLTLGTNNTAKITIKNNGNVGIGTVSPESKLHVNGQVLTEQASAISYAAGDTLIYSDDAEYGIIDDATDASYKLMKKFRVSKNGTVRIKFSAFNSSGSYWWGWKIAVNSGNIMTLKEGGNAYGRRADKLDNATHSAHEYRPFKIDVKGLNPGDVVEVWMVSTDGSGYPVNGAGQTLYLKNFRVYSNSPSVESVTGSVIGTRIGVGTTDPNSLIHLYKTSGNNAEVDIQSVNGTNKHWAIYQDRTTEQLRFRHTGSNNVMNFTTGGNVGIGTPTPGALLDIKGAYPQLILNNPTAGAGIKLLFQNNGQPAGFIGHYDSTSRLQFSSTGSNRVDMTINNNGNVGIGTTNPISRLQLSQAISSPILTIAGSQGAGKEIGIGVDADGGFIQQYGATNVRFYINGATRMLLDSAGKVGIGTTAPDAKLTVVGSADYTSNYPQFVIRDSTDQNKTIKIGYDSTNNIGFIQAHRFSDGYKPLSLNPNGGNVGIGTTSPNATLDILKTNAIASIYTRGNGSTAAAINSVQTDTDGVLQSVMFGSNYGSTVFGVSTNSLAAIYISTFGTVHPSALAIGTIGGQPLIFGTTNAERMRIDNTGRVGIGTTSPNAQLSLGSTVANSKLLLFDNGSNYYGFGIAAGELRMHIADNLGKFTFYDAPAGNALMTVKGDGKVGIGIINPAGQFHIQGTSPDIRIESAVGTENVSLSFIKTATKGWSIGNKLHSSSKDFVINNDTNLGGTDFVTVDETGRVGIGTTTPTAGTKLDVNGAIKGATFTNAQNPLISANLAIQPTAGTSLMIFSTQDSTSLVNVQNNIGVTVFDIDTTNKRIGINTTSPSYDLHVNGSAGKPGGGSWTDSSDIRLKKDINNLSGALEKILKLQGITYNWKNPSEHGNQTGVQAGFVAQDLEKIFPEWIGENDPTGKDKNLVGSGGKIKNLYFPHGFNAYLIEAIKSLKKIIDNNYAELLEKYQKQEAEITNLKKENLEMKKAICEIKPSLKICK